MHRAWRHTAKLLTFLEREAKVFVKRTTTAWPSVNMASTGIWVGTAGPGIGVIRGR